jgi:hypothetical protein
LAVAIICLGSLINFHQYKIWGKPLIPNFVGYKRDIEKYTKTVSFSKLTGSHHHFYKDFQGNDFDFPTETIRTQYGPVSFVSIDLSQKIPVTSPLTSSGLRGPPVS